MRLGKLLSNVCSTMFNMRGNAREPRNGEVEISWIERGELVSVSGAFRNLSAGGIGVVCAQSFRPGTAVYIGPIGNSKAASVRHCRRSGDQFIVGCEFLRVSESIAEKPPSKPVRLKYV